MSALPVELESTQQLLTRLTSELGPTTEMAFGGSCLKLVFAQTGPNSVVQLLESMGARIDANAVLPGATNAGTRMLLGEVLSVPFTARTYSTGDDHDTEIQLFAAAGRSRSHAAQLDASHQLADAVFSTHRDADKALVAYLARRLARARQSGDGAKMVADIAALVADHLAVTTAQHDGIDASALAGRRRSA